MLQLCTRSVFPSARGLRSPQRPAFTSGKPTKPRNVPCRGQGRPNRLHCRPLEGIEEETGKPSLWYCEREWWVSRRCSVSLSLRIHSYSLTAPVLGTPQVPLPQFHLPQIGTGSWDPQGRNSFQGFEALLASRPLQALWYLSHNTTSTAFKAWVLMLEQDCWPWRV